MKRFTIAAAFVACAALYSASAMADTRRDAILAEFLAQARQEDPSFTEFSAERGKVFFHAKQAGGKPDTPSCTTCHTETPQAKGRTRAGKEIDPIAVSGKPTRFTDPAEVGKWFGRNCKSVLGRECTAAEKGDFITFMTGQ